MKTWVWGKQILHPEIDYKDLMKDFIYGYYGECGDEIYQYEMLLIDLREKAHKIPHNPDQLSNIKIVDGIATVNVQESKNRGVDNDRGIRWNPDAPFYTDRFVDKSMKLMDKALAKAKTEEMRDKIRYMRLGPIYLKLGREVGYFNGANNWVGKNFNRKKTDYYLSLVNEIDETLDKLGVKTVAETMPWEGNKTIYIDKWKNVLTLDYEGFEKQEFSDNWFFRGDGYTQGKDSGIPKEVLDSDWKPIEIGKEWDLQGYSEIIGKGWYKKVFSVTEDMLKKENIYLATQGVDEEITVFVNGKMVLEHTQETENKTIVELYTTPIVCDIKPYLKVGENDITVMVGNYKGYGGLYRPLYLVPTTKPKSDKEVVNYMF